MLPSQFEYVRLLEHKELFVRDNPANKYDIVKTIGQGGYGKIFLC